MTEGRARVDHPHTGRSAAAATTIAASTLSECGHAVQQQHQHATQGHLQESFKLPMKLMHMARHGPWSRTEWDGLNLLCSAVLWSPKDGPAGLGAATCDSLLSTLCRIDSTKYPEGTDAKANIDKPSLLRLTQVGPSQLVKHTVLGSASSTPISLSHHSDEQQAPRWTAIGCYMANIGMHDLLTKQ